jgi:hypothetical protein
MNEEEMETGYNKNYMSIGVSVQIMKFTARKKVIGV